MRRTLGSLTLRGRAFLASGLTAAVCGLALLERDLTRMGLLVAALPLVAGAFVVRRSHRLEVRREAEASSVSVGETTRVGVHVENAGPAAGLLLLEERLPDVLGGSPRFVVAGLARRESTHLEYAVTPSARGRHRLGPMTVRRREPFGMVEVVHEIPGTASLLVLPTVVALPTLRLTGGRFATGDDAPRSSAVGSVADVMVREYRRGDDLRRVHWRSTARTGELMVRNEEQLWRPRALVALDTRRATHRGHGAGSSLEAAVVTAASVVVHLGEAGYAVRLVTADGLVDPGAGPNPDATALLETLADLDLSDAPTMPVLPTDEESAGVVVAVTGEDQPADRAWWAGLAARGAQGLALRLAVEDWTEEGAGDTAASTDRRSSGDAADWLGQQGWRVARLGRRTPLAQAWQGLGS